MPDNIPIELSFYINKSVNKDKVKVSFFKYTLTEQCQTILEDQKQNKAITLSLKHPTSFVSEKFEAKLTNSELRGNITATLSQDEITTFTFSNLDLTSDLNTLIIIYSEIENEPKEIFINSTVITLLNYFSINNVDTFSYIIPSETDQDEIIYKNVTLNLQFTQTIHYTNNKFILYSKSNRI